MGNANSTRKRQRVLSPPPRSSSFSVSKEITANNTERQAVPGNEAMNTLVGRQASSKSATSTIQPNNASRDTRLNSANVWKKTTSVIPSQIDTKRAASKTPANNDIKLVASNLLAKIETKRAASKIPPNIDTKLTNSKIPANIDTQKLSFIRPGTLYSPTPINSPKKEAKFMSKFPLPLTPSSNSPRADHLSYSSSGSYGNLIAKNYAGHSGNSNAKNSSPKPKADLVTNINYSSPGNLNANNLLATLNQQPFAHSLKNDAVGTSPTYKPISPQSTQSHIRSLNDSVESSPLYTQSFNHSFDDDITSPILKSLGECKMYPQDVQPLNTEAEMYFSPSEIIGQPSNEFIAYSSKENSSSPSNQPAYNSSTTLNHYENAEIYAELSLANIMPISNTSDALDLDFPIFESQTLARNNQSVTVNTENYKPVRKQSYVEVLDGFLEHIAATVTAISVTSTAPNQSLSNPSVHDDNDALSKLPTSIDSVIYTFDESPLPVPQIKSEIYENNLGIVPEYSTLQHDHPLEIQVDESDVSFYDDIYESYGMGTDHLLGVLNAIDEEMKTSVLFQNEANGEIPRRRRGSLGVWSHMPPRKNSTGSVETGSTISARKASTGSIEKNNVLSARKSSKSSVQTNVLVNTDSFESEILDGFESFYKGLEINYVQLDQ